MIHAKELLDRLGGLSICDFDGEVCRATRSLAQWTVCHPW
jgi:hypothetical protein